MEAYSVVLDREIHAHLEGIFLSMTDRNNYRTLEMQINTFQSLRDAARLRVADRRSIWNRNAEETGPSLGVKIQSKK